MVSQYKINSPIGPIYLVSSDKGLRGVYWNKQPGPLLKKLDASNQQQAILKDISCQLREYFNGRRKEFNAKYDINGTIFQKQVWNALARIPFGQTVSYRDIAKEINHPKAFRAVGTANSRNPISILVPCHRVIAANGTIGGYSGGISKKKKLLKLETR